MGGTGTERIKIIAVIVDIYVPINQMTVRKGLLMLAKLSSDTVAPLSFTQLYSEFQLQFDSLSSLLSTFFF